MPRTFARFALATLPLATLPLAGPSGLWGSSAPTAVPSVYTPSVSYRSPSRDRRPHSTTRDTRPASGPPCPKRRLSSVELIARACTRMAAK